MLERYSGDANAPVFTAGDGSARAISRTEFTNTLKARLMLANRHLTVPVDIAVMSGISFRKGGLSALAGLVSTDRLADHGDHNDVRATREYTEQTVGERALHTTLQASRFQARAQ